MNEVELPYGQTSDLNCCATAAQVLGSMAPEDKAGDDNLRLGFEVHGTIRTDDPTDADVYTFNAPAGTEIWLDIDRTNHALDPGVELIKADGTVLARSDNSYSEKLDGYVEDLSTEAYTMNRDYWLRHDFYSTNDKDAGMRLVLPGPEGAMRTYYVRVRQRTGDRRDSRGRSVLLVRWLELHFGRFGKQAVHDCRRVPVAAIRVHGEHQRLRGFEHPVDLRTESGELRTPSNWAQAIVDAVAKARLEGLEVTARVLDGKVVLDGMARTIQRAQDVAGPPGEHVGRVPVADPAGGDAGSSRLDDSLCRHSLRDQRGSRSSAARAFSASGRDGRSREWQHDRHAQQIGNLLQVDQNAISVAGYLEGRGRRGLVRHVG